MRRAVTFLRRLACWGAGMALVLPAWGQAPGATRDEPVRLRIVGGLANVSQYKRHEEPFWSQRFAALTGGKASAEIVPFDQAGIRGQELLRLMQVGTVPFATALLSQVATQEPELGAPDLVGLSPDMKTLRRVVAAYRPHMARLLRERHGIELLAVYVYPAQVLFCAKPFAGLADLSGRRVRTSNSAQSDLVLALRGTPVQAAFADIVSHMKAGNIDCAITGTMSGNTIGLHELTSHVHAMAVNWGAAIFGANLAAWNALPEAVRGVMRTELPKLEQAIWADSERDSGEGLACNVGAATCTSGRKGRMTEVKATADDERRLREIVNAVVLPNWLQRCGPGCVAAWNDTIAPVVGIQARPR